MITGSQAGIWSNGRPKFPIRTKSLLKRPIRFKPQYTHRQTMPVTREEIVSCYRIILGREPESDNVINGYLSVPDFQTLRSTFLNSAEFQESAAYLIGSVQKLPFLALNLPANPIDYLATSSQLGQCIARIKTVWSHLGVIKPHFSVLTHSDFLPENLGGNIDTFWSSGDGDATDVEKILERHGYGSIADKTCVEYGCGVGRVSSALVRRFKRVHAYDISEGHLAVAQQRLNDIGAENGQLHLCSDRPLDPLEKCDVFFSRIVFQHNPPPVIHHLVKNAFQALNPGGIAIFQVPTYQTGYSFNIEKWLAAKLTLEMEMHCLPQHAIFTLAEEEGCELREVREDDSAGLFSQFVSNSFVVRKRRCGTC
jgi:SAM-dependent methyltransferase